MIGARYKCPTCKNKSQKKTVTFMSWDSDIIKSLPKGLSAEFTIVLTHHSGMTDGLFSLQCSLLHKGLGTQQFRDILKVQHLRQFDQLQIQYLELIDYTRAASPWKNSIFGGLYTPPHIPCGLQVDSRSTPGVHVEFRHFFFGGSPAKFLSRIHLESNRSPPGLQLLHVDNMESTSEHREYEITQQDSIWSPHEFIAFNSVIPFII